MRRIDEATFIRLFYSYISLQARQAAAMSLTGAEVSELIELGEVLESASVLDRREHHRLRLTTPVTLKRGSWIRGGVGLDISGGGLQVGCADALERGATVLVTITAGDSDHIFTCEVVRQTEEGWALRFVGLPLELHHGSRRQRRKTLPPLPMPAAPL